ncbi:MAG: hypothetical protein LBG71_01360 [Clostridiales Family XIII bacterium]|jgi:hypothetical protein|nr:hypothetical protein [Clostridiales Family XIII bacterium]
MVYVNGKPVRLREDSRVRHCGLDPQSPDPQFEILNQVQNDDEGRRGAGGIRYKKAAPQVMEVTE